MLYSPLSLVSDVFPFVGKTFLNAFWRV